ncbi:MAG: hypothetical protein KGZ69_02690 [Methylomonas sp.]|nr:hypothetical protein [Methylomonas sp.]
MSSGAYASRIKKILPKELRRIFSRLTSPQKIQDFLDTVPANFELNGETARSPLSMLTAGNGHCFEGAVFAAAALAYHGQRPLLLDFETKWDDEDHIVALFKQSDHWGAISKTNHAVLKYRDPIYESPREIALSYFNEYYLWDGRKSMIAYSRPFDLSRFAPEQWITTTEELDWLMEKIAQSGYYEIVPPNTKVRKASEVELEALKCVQWSKPSK